MPLLRAPRAGSRAESGRLGEFAVIFFGNFFSRCFHRLQNELWVSFSRCGFHVDSIFTPIFHPFRRHFWAVVSSMSKLKSNNYLLCFEHIQCPINCHFLRAFCSNFQTSSFEHSFGTHLDDLSPISSDLGSRTGPGERSTNSGFQCV